MKKIVHLFLSLILLSITLPADQIGKMQVSSPHQPMNQSSNLRTYIMTEQIFNQGLTRGEFALSRQQSDSLYPDRTHYRYIQLFEGLRVFGGNIVVERERDRIISINGHYYPIEKVDMTQNLTPKKAYEKFAAELGITEMNIDSAQTIRMIYPKDDGTYQLCYQITIQAGPSHNETALVDTKDGSLYALDSNLKFDTRIGIGTDFHGVNRKFPHTLENERFYLWDDQSIRPIKLATYDMRSGGYVAQNSSEYWQGNGVNVSAHFNAGLVYDFLYLFLGRRGLNNNDLQMLVVTYRNEYTDNASWNGESINFYLTGSNQAQYAAALDIVGHECAHGVTQFSSNLVYSFQSGALNESFSDIMGAAVEIYWQPSGSGLNHADWYIGEDAFPSYNYGISNGKVRYMADPNRFSQFGNPSLPDPCHLSQYYDLPFSTDRGGVHVNMTIYSHAFYLLTAGGTNRISKKSVTGIGLEKALKIFYRAWVYKLTENSQFVNAAQALLDSAYELYGQGSTEYTQTIRAIEAIGYTVN